MTMNKHTQLVEQFYGSFQRKDYADMIACYHPQIHFSDPVFTDLRGQRAAAMWHMLIERGQDLTLIYEGVQADENSGRAHWEATYTFSTGRKVVNVIDAQFKFAEGKIIEHRDHFDLWRWTRMALGPMGVLLGWTPLVQNKVRQTAAAGLEKFIEKHPEYQ